MLARILIFSLGLGGVGVAQTVTVAVSPPTATNRVGETRAFAATVRNTLNTTVTWTTTTGSITSAGVFTAPATLPLGGLATIRATSVADPTKFAMADVSLQNARPTITSLNPTSVNTGMPYTLLIVGSNFLPTSTVTAEGVSAAVTYPGPMGLQVSAVATNLPGNAIDVIVSNPDPGASSSGMMGMTVLAAVRVTVNPTGATVVGGASLRFTAAVANTNVTTVNWFVNGVAGGNTQVGLIDGSGQYTAPSAPPAGGRVEIKAVSVFDGRGEGMVVATIQNGVPVLSGVTPDTVTVGANPLGVLQFNSGLLVPQAGPGGATFSLTGSLFAPTARGFLGGRELSTTYVSSTQLRAAGTMGTVVGQMAMLRVVNPAPGGGESGRLLVRFQNARQLVSYSAAVRFLEQASFGATPEAIARVQELGTAGWLAEQFSLPMTPLADAAPPVTQPNGSVSQEGMSRLQTTWLTTALRGRDQLRYRVGFALHSMIVVSAIDLGEHRQYVPYLRILHEEAFGNYRRILGRITLNPAMGRYLNMMNNAKGNIARNTVANENYARELLQLFTLGLVELNVDGTPRVGSPVTYDEGHVAQLAKVFTGWTAAPLPGALPRFWSPENWGEPMVAIEAEHDPTQKNILPNVTVPSGLAASEDINVALDAIFNHPNIGPFVSFRLIQRLVTSNPSPGYVARVARVFNSNSLGVRGDLKAVVEAILMDSEAGTQTGPLMDLPGSQGSLREPLLLTLQTMRALDMQSTGALANTINGLGQNLFYPGSVFSYFSPFSQPGPEFQTLNATTALNTVNLMYRLTSNGTGSAAVLDLAPWDQLATNPDALVTAAANALARGVLPANVRSLILQAVGVQTSNRMKAITALYLVAASPEVLVKR